MPDSAKPTSSASFTTTALQEAAARRLRVDLVGKKVNSRAETRLQSHFLGLGAACDDLVLAAPESVKGGKVFLPPGWSVGLSFQLDHLWLQGRSQVLRHAMFPDEGGRRVDAVVCELPQHLVVRSGRTAERHVVELDVLLATVWAEDPATGELQPPWEGLVQDWSEGGLGLQLRGRPPWLAEQNLLIRMVPRGSAGRPLCRGVLKYVREEAGHYRVGIGEVRPLRPGEAPELISRLAAPHIT